MIVDEQESAIELAAPAKVNLFLETLRKRPDGYHDLETIMVAVSLFDRLSLRSIAGETEFHCDEPNAGLGPDNLVCRAVKLMREISGRRDGLFIRLSKRVPIAAGLAGGSSDAAATLVGLNRLWRLNWSVERLAELAARLGADVPFFLHGPAAICRGKGEIVEPIKLAAPLHLVVVKPVEGLSTKRSFEALRTPEKPRSIDPMLAALRTGDPKQIARATFNRLEEVAIRISPAVAAMKARSADWPCEGSMMSGSGTSFFAVCSNAEQADSLARRLRAAGDDRVFAVTSL